MDVVFFIVYGCPRMQDKDTEPDEDICVKVNLYMSDYAEAALAAGSTLPATASRAAAGVNNSSAVDNAELLRIMQGALGSQGLQDPEGELRLIFTHHFILSYCFMMTHD